MKQTTWLISVTILVVGSIAADKPDQTGKKPAAGVEPTTKPIPKTRAMPKATEAASPTVAADPRATSLFRSAQNLEKNGKTPGAIGLYRDVLIRYPQSPEANESTARIKALGGKVPAPSEIRPAPPAEEAKFIRAPKPKYASQDANRAAINQMIGGAISQPAVSGPANKPPY